MKKISTLSLLIIVFLLGVYGSSVYKQFDFSIGSILNMELNDPTRNDLTKGENVEEIKNMINFKEGTLPTSQLYLTKMYEEYETDLNKAKTITEFKKIFDEMTISLTRAAISFESGASIGELEKTRTLIENQLDKLQLKAHYLNQNTVHDLTNEQQQKDFISYNPLYKEMVSEREEIENDIEKLKKQLQGILTDKMDASK